MCPYCENKFKVNKNSTMSTSLKYETVFVANSALENTWTRHLINLLYLVTTLKCRLKVNCIIQMFNHVQSKCAQYVFNTLTKGHDPKSVETRGFVVRNRFVLKSWRISVIQRVHKYLFDCFAFLYLGTTLFA